MSTKIEWVQKDGMQGETWNPIVGCSKVSPGCAHCYAETLARRLKAMGRPQYQDAINGNGHWTGRVILVPEKLNGPLKRQKPTTYFVNSMSDLFHESLTWMAIERIFMVMVRARQHTFQVLTKRAHVMAEFVNACFPGLAECSPHIQLGVSVENQKAADERIAYLLQTPAAIRFLSFEPLLGPIDLAGYIGIDLQLSDYDGHIGNGVDWVIVGCESGPRRRPMELDWARDLLAQCRAAEVAVFVKQLPINGRINKNPLGWPEDLRVREFPK